MIGMFSSRDNQERLEKIEQRLKRRDLHDEERQELETNRAELLQWFRDLDRFENYYPAEY